MSETTINTVIEEDFIHKMGVALSAPAAPNPAYKMTAQDRAEYLAMLNGEQPTPIPNEQANRILDQLWSVMVAFVDLGFPPCGQVNAQKLVKRDMRGSDALQSPHQSDRQNNKAAPVNAADRRES